MTTTENNKMLLSALRYAKRGWAVLPVYEPRNGKCTCGHADCSSPGKHPRTQHGVKDASKNPDQIKMWWSKWPNANIAIATGLISEAIVLDVDPRTGGNESLEKLFGQRGLPPTPTVRTGGGGMHAYLAWAADCDRNRTAILRGLDIRAQGGFVVAPPSGHLSGGRYSWQTGRGHEDIELAPIPSSLRKLLLTPSSKPRTTEPIVEGGRWTPNGTKGCAPIAQVLARLENVRLASDGWIARCPGHADNRPSLSIAEGQDGRVLLHCFAGCGIEEILAAIGLEMSDLFPCNRTKISRKVVNRHGPHA